MDVRVCLVVFKCAFIILGGCPMFFLEELHFHVASGHGIKEDPVVLKETDAFERVGKEGVF